MMDNKKVLALVVTYNRKDLLLESLEALLAQTKSLDILVIDNDSTDGTYDKIAHLVESNQISYQNTQENLGGAGGFNFALKRAAGLSEPYEYFWLMDDDTIVEPDALEAFLAAANDLDNQFGFLSSYAAFTDGQPCKMNVQSLAKDWQQGLAISSNLIKISKATFVSFFVKKETVIKLGLPIKDFFIWADDSEYSQRISAKLPSYLVTNSRLIHKMQANADANFKVFLTEETDRYRRYYYSFRNRFYIAKQKGFKASSIYLLKLLAISGLTIVKAKSFRWKKTGVVLKGMLDGMRFNPTIEYVREGNSKND